jgi:hypothetical protein
MARGVAAWSRLGPAPCLSVHHGQRRGPEDRVDSYTCRVAAAHPEIRSLRLGYGPPIVRFNCGGQP